MLLNTHDFISSKTLFMRKLILWIAGSLFTTMLAAQAPVDLIPKPVQMEVSAGIFTLTPSTVIASNTAGHELAGYLQDKLKKSTGYHLKTSTHALNAGQILLEVNTSLDLPKEGYRLTVNEKGAVITGKDRGGLFNGIQTLLQLFPPKIYSDTPAHDVAWTVPFIRITDYPRFSYRGMMLDVSRQFFDIATVKKYIDWLSMHKMNKFHWHLSDDQGWRIEIKHYPALTTKGAWRGPNELLEPSYGSGEKRFGGFYTQKEIREVVRYAALRNIEIIPEIDMPGHSRAAAVAYPNILCKSDSIGLNGTTLVSEDLIWHNQNVWCVGNEQNYTMLKTILKELAGLFPSRTIHIGGDEVNPYYWKHCSRCQSLMKDQQIKNTSELQHYFIHRLEGILHSLGKQMSGWDEITDGGTLDTTTTIYAWRSTVKAAEAVSKHYPTVLVMGSYFYFDMAQSPNDRGHDWAGLVPLERVYSFNPLKDSTFTAESFRSVKGVQGALWSELLNEPEHFIEYQSYPRIAALAEVGWTSQNARNWDDFYTRLTCTHFQRLNSMNIAFRLPPPVASYRSGYVSVTPPFNGAEVHYTMNAALPTMQSPIYHDSIRISSPDSMRFRTFYNSTLASIAVSPVRASIGIWNTVGQAAVVQKSWNLTPVFNKAGNWDITFNPDSVSKTLSIDQVTLLENGNKVASAHAQPFAGKWRYRLEAPAYDGTKNYSLRADIKSLSLSSGSVQVQLLPYLTPETGITVNMPITNHDALPLSDYNFNTTVSCRGNAKAGDALTFVFASPLVCKSILSVTGKPMLSLFPVKNGHLEVSYDGIQFVFASKYQKGIASITPDRPVKAVRIVIDGPTEDPVMVIQDLRIE